MSFSAHREVANIVRSINVRTKSELTAISLVVPFLMLSVFPGRSFGLEAQAPVDSIINNLREELPDMLAEASIPGAVVVVVDDKDVVWQQVYGHVNDAESRRIDAHTIFSVQSMTKSFTAVAVLTAVQHGLVDLDSPISEYLPGFTVKSIFGGDPTHTITLRHLLSHRAGLTHEAPYGSNYDSRNDFSKHIESISDTWLRYPVGYRYSYSNLGVDLAGYIVEKRSGRPFVSYVEEEVLDPLGMTGSSLDIELIEREKNRAVGHAADDVPPLRIPMIPAGGLYTNIRDMGRYLRFHINRGAIDGRRILRSDLLEEMHAIQFPHPRQRFGYCLGIIRDPVSDSYCVYHAGGGYGFTSMMLIFPEKKIGVALLANSDNESVIWGLRSRVRESMEDELGPTPVEEPETERMTGLETDDPRVQAIVGRYGDEYGYVIGYENDGLGIRTTQNSFYPLAFYDDGGELVGLYGHFSEVRFLPEYGGRRGSMMLIDRRLSNHGFSVRDFNDSPSDPPGPDRPHWSEYLGIYEILRDGEPLDTFSVTKRNGYLYAAECRCVEHQKGLFFMYDGEALDFRSDRQSAGNIRFRRRLGSE